MLMFFDSLHGFGFNLWNISISSSSTVASDYNTHIQPVLGSRLYRSQVRKGKWQGLFAQDWYYFSCCTSVQQSLHMSKKIGKIFLLHHVRSRSHVTGVAQPPPQAKESILGWDEVTVSRLAFCMALCAAPRCSQSVQYSRLCLSRGL